MAIEEGTEPLSVKDIYAYLKELSANRPSLKLAEGRSAKGANTLKQILAASNEIFINEGYAGLTIRKVAKKTGLSVGNVNYYFSAKHDLIVATLEEALADYVEEHIAHMKENPGSPMDVLLDVVGFYARTSATSYRLFFQMWGYAGSSAKAKQVLRDLYRPVGRFIYYLVRAANPDFTPEEARSAVFQIFSLEQGMKLFIGMGPEDDMAVQSAEELLRNATQRLVRDGGNDAGLQAV